MANMLKMEQVHLIQQLIDKGWTHRRIAREFGFHRSTIRKYLAARDRSDPACTISPAESEPRWGNAPHGGLGRPVGRVPVSLGGRRSRAGWSRA